jgi:hypothetical protein
MKNVPTVNAGIVAVSRDCFLAELSRKRRVKVVEECRAKNIPVVELQTIVENETDVLKALEELREKKVNALVLTLATSAPKVRRRFSPRNSTALSCLRQLPRKRGKTFLMGGEMHIADFSVRRTTSAFET